MQKGTMTSGDDSGSGALLTSTMYFSYSQFLVFDSSVQAPECAPTRAHADQGFARRTKSVLFGTLLDFGYADLTVYAGPYVEKPEYERVIEVPLHVPSGEVRIKGPEEIKSERSIKLDKGYYRLVAAQVVKEEEEIIDLFFEKVTGPLLRSRIWVADDRLKPPTPLLETVDELP